MAGLLEGKVAIITGAASGMGVATAERFVEEGARVVLADINEEAGNATAQRLGENTRFIRTDVTAETEVEALVASAVEAFGQVDVFYSNAGAAGDVSPIDELSPAGLDRTLSLNLAAHVSAHKFAARQFRAQGTAGSIITTASIAALQAGWNGGAYSMAKAAVMALVRQTAFECQGTGIRSNAILPGAILTPLITTMFDVKPEDGDEFLRQTGEAISSTNLIGDPGTPKDIANAALFLASDLSSWITGTGLTVDGGATAASKDETVALIGEVAERFHA